MPGLSLQAASASPCRRSLNGGSVDGSITEFPLTHESAPDPRRDFGIVALHRDLQHVGHRERVPARTVDGRVRSDVLADARELADGAEVDVDLCIVGAGPAGISIARELVGNGHRVWL